MDSDAVVTELWRSLETGATSGQSFDALASSAALKMLELTQSNNTMFMTILKMLINQHVDSVYEISGAKSTRRTLFFPYKPDSPEGMFDLLLRVVKHAVAEARAVDDALVWKSLSGMVLLEVARLVQSDDVPSYIDFLFRCEQLAPVNREMAAWSDLALVGSTISRKLSETSNADLLGKLNWWITEHLPTVHRPMLNISHVINDSHPIGVDENFTGSEGNEFGDAIEPGAYKLFWGFQASAYSVESGLTKPEDWPLVKRQIECILEACSGPTQVSSEAALQTCGEGTVAYLSSGPLLPMQLRDASFRRNILVQALMFVHRGLHTEDLLGRRPRDRNPKEPLVRERQKQDCRELYAALMTALQATPSEGHAFAAHIESQLQAEEAFSHWKHDLRTITEKNRLRLDSEAISAVEQKLKGGGTGQAIQPPIDSAIHLENPDSVQTVSRTRSERPRSGIPRSLHADRLASVTDTSQWILPEDEEQTLIVDLRALIDHCSFGSEFGEVEKKREGKGDKEAMDDDTIAKDSPLDVEPEMASAVDSSRIKNANDEAATSRLHDPLFRWRLMRRLARLDIKKFADSTHPHLSEVDNIKYAAVGYLMLKRVDIREDAKNWHTTVQEEIKKGILADKKSKPKREPKTKPLAVPDEATGQPQVFNPDAVPFVHKSTPPAKPDGVAAALDKHVAAKPGSRGGRTDDALGHAHAAQKQATEGDLDAGPRRTSLPARHSDRRLEGLPAGPVPRESTRHSAVPRDRAAPERASDRGERCNRVERANLPAPPARQAHADRAGALHERERNGVGRTSADAERTHERRSVKSEPAIAEAAVRGKVLSTQESERAAGKRGSPTTDGPASKRRKQIEFASLEAPRERGKPGDISKVAERAERFGKEPGSSRKERRR